VRRGLTHASTERRIAAGAVAGVILGVLTIATFAMVDNVAVIRTCAAAFEAVWERAIPHGEYRSA